MGDDIRSLLWLLLLSSSSSSFSSDLDVQCLKTVQQSVIDPNGFLKSSRDFVNRGTGYICAFTGVECWHLDENRVLSLRLSNLSLEGQFPRGLENCTNMSGLDLSYNNFSGPIPSDIARKLPYLTSLDLSYNSFSGEIPIGISNLSYLNTLNLQHNQLSGPISWQFNRFVRLEQFNVADNQLSGPIPSAFSKFPASNFAGNQGLCGIQFAGNQGHRINDESSIGAAAGFVVGFVVAFYFPHCFVCSRRLHPYIFRL